GLLGLNKAFVTHCGAEIVSALRLLSNINHYPVLVHCTQGKDRTGLVVGLALHCAGVTEEFILKDYVRTQEGLKAQYEVMVEEMRKTGLDSSFSDAPEEVMRETLKFIRETYGSIDGYLDSLKFGPAERTRL
ncbi:protein-tyrosine phosphatase-like protein, partial [Phlyctochytrium arcticum]